ncbi:hypothetical protein Aperf_G00000078163 [Anoplocephala perfoliata]
MFHNHDIIIRPTKAKPEPYTVISDYTNQFVEMFPSLVFYSFRQFEDKMEEFQTKTGCVYTKRHTCPWPKDDLEHRDLVYKKLAYECFHYGYKREALNEKPDRRSAIFITCRNNALHITRYEMRHNHPLSGSCGNLYRPKRRLTFEQQSLVKNLLRKQEHEIIIKQYIQDNFDVCMTTAEVRNLKRKLKPKRTPRIFGFTLKSLENQGFADIISDESDEHRIISFTSPALIKNFHFYPEVLQIRQFGVQSLRAYSFSTIDRKLESRTVMYSFILDHEFTGNLTPLLHSFKGLVQSGTEDIETIFVDPVPMGCSEIQAEFPQARILFYQSGVLDNVKDHLKDPRFSKYDRSVVFQEFVNAVMALDAEKYAASLQRIGALCPPFLQFLEQTWLPYVDHWAEHLRLDNLTFGVSSRNSSFLHRLESLLPHSEENLDASVKRLLNLASPSKEEDDRVGRGIDLHGQPEDIQALLRLLSEPVALVLIRHLEEPLTSLEMISDPSVRSCCCQFSLQWRLPCVHLMNAARLAYIPLPSLLKDSRWLESWTLDCIESENAVEAVIGGDGANESDPEVLSSGTKIMKIDEQLQSIQKIVVTSDADKFNRRRRELKELERRWLQEDESLSS